MKKVEAVLLAAGKGIRLGELGRDRQKTTLTVGNVPLITHNINVLSEFCKKICIIVGHKKNDVLDIVEKINANKNIEIEIIILEQKEIIGTANAVEVAAGHINGPFIVSNADIYLKSEDVRKILGKKPSVMAVSEVEDPWNYGVAMLDEHENLKNIIEKPEKGKEPSNLINAGIYYFVPEIFDAIKITPLSKTKEYWLTDSILLLINKFHKQISTVKISKPIKIITHEDYQKYKDLKI